MTQWLLAASFFTVFYFMLCVGAYSAIKLYCVLSGQRGFRAFKTVALWTMIYLVLMFAARNYWTDAYRWLLYYLGVVSFAFFISLPFWFAVVLAYLHDFFALLKSRWLATGYVTLTLLVSLLAVVNYHREPVVVEYDVYSDKLTSPLRLVQLTDTQYGSISRKEMEAHFRQVYALEPDLIAFTGDLIDFDYYEREDFSVIEESPVPIYFERGNHEFYHDEMRLLNYLRSFSSIKLLINQQMTVGELEIVGVDYSRGAEHLDAILASMPRDPSKFSLLLYHDPKGVERALPYNFDLLLFGHTHGGQIWPFTWLVDQMYTYGDGFFEFGDATVYVSDGAGLWGPRMRLGSQNEIVVFNLLPAVAE